MPKPDERPMRFLVICVDRDDDLGVKTGIKSPVIGKENVLEAGLKLIMTDPEEADANTMFEAVRIMENLQAKDEENVYEVVVLTGSREDDIEADRRISEGLRQVLEVYPADAAILVSDGYTDQQVFPIIQSQVPIISVRRFAVKHSQSLETSWYIITRYLSMLLQDPRYTKWTLGLPGIIVLFLSILYVLTLFYPEIPLLPYTTAAVLIITGLTLFVKGFEIDKSISYVFSEVASRPSILIRVFGYVAGIIICGLGISQGFSSVAENVPLGSLTDFQMFMKYSNVIIASFIEGVSSFFLMGLSVMLAGRALFDYIHRNLRLLIDIVGLISVFMIIETVIQSTPILREPPQSITSPEVMGFLLWILLAITMIAASSLIAHRLREKLAKTWRD
ncbi:MAG: Hypothetical protein AYL29_009600 [Candidatus Bathyarchaeota archaeon B24]|nr:MAG: Hypothetical protein AYL29_009600 [Candidatus Bathyarchaeota archaeon B24]RLI26056.1 MAG: hypothetical protein DRO57_02150 [Candidatus Bathyarchaeota archaeon]